jgi:glucose-fructose oxidoreductase
MRFAQVALLTAFVVANALPAQSPEASPLRIGVVGLVHGHVAGFFDTVLKRTDIQLIGIAETDRSLFDKYAARYHLSTSLYFPSLEDMISRAHPPAVVVYTNTYDHRKVVERCAHHGVHVMMEKPLAVSYADARAMAVAAHSGNIHVLVNYETTWYASNKAAHDLLTDGKLGALRKIVVRDGHQGPKEIHVQPEFFAWLTNPELNGAGALFDFGCYGADLSTWLHNGAPPQTVTAVTQQIKPAIYPHVDDEANVILKYPDSVAILEPSWNWPFSIKDLQVYGRTAEAKTILRERIQIVTGDNQQSRTIDTDPLRSPYDDSLHYFAAVINGQVNDEGSLSSLKTNLIVTEILDGARRSAKESRTIHLPLND